METKSKKYSFSDIIKNNIVVHCNSEIESREFLIKCKEHGLKWGCTPSRTIDVDKDNIFYVFKLRTCYIATNDGKLAFGSLDGFVEKYKIIEFEDIEGNKMTDLYFHEYNSIERIYSCTLVEVLEMDEKFVILQTSENKKIFGYEAFIQKSEINQIKYDVDHSRYFMLSDSFDKDIFVDKMFHHFEQVRENILTNLYYNLENLVKAEQHFIDYMKKY